MICAYDKSYVDEAMNNLGDAFDYAVNECGIEIESFYDLFVSCEIARRFDSGDPKYLVGMSGIELAYEVMDLVNIEIEKPKPKVVYDRSMEYWVGWILAYYQWKTGRRLKDIGKHLSANEIVKLYPTLHEASEDKFVDVVNKIISRNKGTTNLRQIRMDAGYTQKELADKSGVTLRMIQQYEQRVKDINKSSVASICALARVLGCGVDDLME